jgi:hypothetical protein
LSVKSNQENTIEQLKNEFVSEFQRMQKSVHHLINHLTAISGYVQIVQVDPGRSVTELHKIIHAVEKSMSMLRACVANLNEVERRYS